MDYIIDNWYLYAASIVVIVVEGIRIFFWAKESSSKKRSQIMGWLLQAVMIAEKELGSGTGALKLSVVYDRFCARFPWIAKILPFEKFKKYVDDALAEMKAILEKNNNIAMFVETKE